MVAQFLKNAGAAAIALMIGVVAGANMTSWLYGRVNPFWSGKGAEWSGVGISAFAAMVTIAAIISAYQSAKKAIDQQRGLREDEKKKKKEDKVARAKLNARIIWREVRDLLVRCKVWQRMLGDNRFALVEVYEHVMGVQCAALEYVVADIHSFEYQNGVDIANCLNSYRENKNSAAMNRAWMANWSDEKSGSAQRSSQ